MYEDCFTSILFSGGFILVNLSAKIVLYSFSRFIQMGQMDWQTACNVHGGDGSRPAPSRRDNNIHKNIFNLCILLYNGDPQHRMLCPLLSNAEIYPKKRNLTPQKWRFDHQNNLATLLKKVTSVANFIQLYKEHNILLYRPITIVHCGG